MPPNPQLHFSKLITILTFYNLQLGKTGKSCNEFGLFFLAKGREEKSERKNSKFFKRHSAAYKASPSYQLADITVTRFSLCPKTFTC